jgi:hypothetical protein
MVALLVLAVNAPVIGGQPESGFPFVGNTYYQARPDAPFQLAGSCVGVGKFWVMGVAHASGQRVVLNGQTYSVTTTIKHPSADLALMKVDTALPSWAEMDFSAGPSLFGKAVKIVACGVDGRHNGRGGVDIVPNSEGVRRSGMNRILGQTERPLTLDGGRQLLTRVLTYDLQEGEGGQAARDSGGGWFVQSGGAWKLVAVCAYVASNASGQRYGIGSLGMGTHLGTYREWIEKTMRQ